MCSDRPNSRRTSPPSRVPSTSSSVSGITGSVTIPARRPPRLLAQRLQHRVAAGELRVEHLARDVEQRAHARVAYGVADRRAFLPGHDHVLGAEHGELLRDRGLIEIESGLELLHRALAATEDLEETDADGMGQRLEELRLEHLELGGGAGHETHEYKN